MPQSTRKRTLSASTSRQDPVTSPAAPKNVRRMSRPRGLQRRFQSSRATPPALTWPGARSLDRYPSLRYGKHRPVDAQLALLARGARTALPAREPRRAARRQRDPGVRGADAGAGDRRRAAGRASPHRRLRRLHLERAADRGGDPAAEGARAGHRRGHRRAGSEPRSRGAGDLPARRPRGHRMGRRDVRAAGRGPAARPAAVEPGARRRAAAAGAPGAAVPRVHRCGPGATGPSTSRHRAAARSSASSACRRWTGPRGPFRSSRCWPNCRTCTSAARATSSSSTARSTSRWRPRCASSSSSSG